MLIKTEILSKNCTTPNGSNVNDLFFYECIISSELKQKLIII